MNLQSIHQQIESLLKTIREQHDQIKQHSSSIPQVEIDFMLQNLRQLYEASLMLNHTNALSSLDEIKAAVTQKILAEKRAIELKRSEDKPEMKKEEEPVADVKSKIEEITVIQKEEVAVQTTIESTVKVSTPTDKPVRKAGNLNSSLYEDKPTLGDKFGSKETLHGKFGSKTPSKSVADKHHKNAIKDLKAAIGINEKFVFINQLFDGNLQRYSEVIEKINSLTDLESAKKLITAELSTTWNEHNEHVKDFMELVERRFVSQ